MLLRKRQAAKFILQMNILLTIGVLVCCPLGACRFASEKSASQKAAIQFHELFNAGRYKEIYEQADENFKSSASEAEAVNVFFLVQRKLGSIEKSVLIRWDVSLSNKGTLVKLIFRTHFSKADAEEHFAYFIKDGIAKLGDYKIFSPSLTDAGKSATP